MISGTTPTLTMRIVNGGDLDLTAALSVYVTVEQKTTEVTKSGADLQVAAQAVSFALTQQEALRLRPGPAEAQINWTYLDAASGETRRAATVVKTISISRQLLDKVVT